MHQLPYKTEKQPNYHIHSKRIVAFCKMQYATNVIVYASFLCHTAMDTHKLNAYVEERFSFLIFK